MSLTEGPQTPSSIEPCAADSARIRGRVLIGYFVISTLAALFLAAFLWPSWLQTPVREPAPEIASGLLSFVLLFGLLVRALRRRGKTIGSIFGPRPDGPAVRWALGTGAALFCLSAPAMYAVFVPLSYLAPEFVQWWLLDLPVIVIWTGEHGAAGVNIAAFLYVVAIGPFVEEVFFRGLLMPTWQLRFGQRRGVVLSAVVFAIAHADIVGALLFGLVIAILFLKTRSLWIPVLIHVTNNLLVWVLSALDLAFSGTLEPLTLGDLQSTWWIGAVGFVIGVPALVRLLRRIPTPDWELLQSGQPPVRIEPLR